MSDLPLQNSTLFFGPDNHLFKKIRISGSTPIIHAKVLSCALAALTSEELLLRRAAAGSVQCTWRSGDSLRTFVNLIYNQKECRKFQEEREANMLWHHQLVHAVLPRKLLGPEAGWATRGLYPHPTFWQASPHTISKMKQSGSWLTTSCGRNLWWNFMLLPKPLWLAHSQGSETI